MARNKKMRRVSVAIGVIVLIAAFFGMLVYCRATRRYEGNTVIIYIPRGATEKQVEDSLRLHLGNDYTAVVIDVLDKLPGNGVAHPGAYKIEHGSKAIDIARQLRNGRQTPVKVTFNNVRTIDDLAAKLALQLDISAEEFVTAADSMLKAEGVSEACLPAHFLPDTYEMYWADPADRVVSRLTEQYDRFWTSERVEKAKRMGLMPEQVATVASIVEEETVKADERPVVARLYLNRLKNGMKLQADPTVKFAVGDFSLRRILDKHLTTQSPYNTYLHHGLPPGPIRIVEGRTLDAVLNAPSNDYLYMCAKEDFSGYHNFAKDYATHQANARRYRQALDSRGIK